MLPNLPNLDAASKDNDMDMPNKLLATAVLFTVALSPEIKKYIKYIAMEFDDEQLWTSINHHPP